MKRDQEGCVFDGRWFSHPPMRNALLSGLLTGIAFALGHFHIVSSFVETILFLVAIPLGGYHWMREGIEEWMEEKKIGIDVLMTAAALGSAILGIWDEAAFLVFLYGAAEGLEEYTYARTRASIRQLLELAPKEARVIRNGVEKRIPAEEIIVGDIFVVRPGESLPTDGTIVKGRSSINEAPVTGESIPVEKNEGMKVFAATMNQEGALEVRAIASFQDNTLAKMVHLVEKAQEQKSKTQAFIERFGNRYSPLVLLSSLLLVVIPSLFGLSLVVWATRAVVLLVAAAPCALVMSTPVAIAVGIGRAGKSGVLVKGGAHLENLGKIKAVAFDKTGTLTRGAPVVTDIVPLNGSALELLSHVYTVERFSEHPLAKAIVKRAEEESVQPLEASEFTALVGSGAKMMINGEAFYVGKPELFAGWGRDIRALPEITRLAAAGKTVVVAGTEEKVSGLIAIRDEIRPEAPEALGEFHRLGIKLIMLTGDNETTARAIARELKMNEVRAGLKPEDKLQAIDELEKSYGAVAMVGDGINDAPALARATIGIAMGVAGTDAAIEAADIALMADDLNKLVYAVRLGRHARRIGLQNIVFSLLVLGILVPSAVIGIMTVAFAVFAHETSELLAVANGLRVAGRLST